MPMLDTRTDMELQQLPADAGQPIDDLHESHPNDLSLDIDGEGWYYLLLTAISIGMDDPAQIGDTSSLFCDQYCMCIDRCIHAQK